jgi:hypothetical protein
MDTNQVVIQGIVDSEGMLKLDQPVPLPPGAVEVTVHPLSISATAADPFWTAMEEIWANQRARGYSSRSKEEIDAEIAAFRDEAEQEVLVVERIHGNAGQLRTPPEKRAEGPR